MQLLDKHGIIHKKLYPSWDDNALVQALRQSDEQAFAAIYRRYGFGLIEQA